MAGFLSKDPLNKRNVNEIANVKIEEIFEKIWVKNVASILGLIFFFYRNFKKFYSKQWIGD